MKITDEMKKKVLEALIAKSSGGDDKSYHNNDDMEVEILEVIPSKKKKGKPVMEHCVECDGEGCAECTPEADMPLSPALIKMIKNKMKQKGKK